MPFSAALTAAVRLILAPHALQDLMRIEQTLWCERGPQAAPVFTFLLDGLQSLPAQPAAPDTSLILNRDLVRGSTATAFEYGGDGFPGGTSLRFTLAVVRDLDGESWDPLTETEGVTALSHLTTSTGAHALTAGGAMASAGAPSDQLPRILVRVRALTSRRLPLLQSTALVGPAGADEEALRADLVAATRALAGDGFLTLR